jgi:ferric-dicitrate binding protein FerR (iron transport regulator)
LHILTHLFIFRQKLHLSQIGLRGRKDTILDKNLQQAIELIRDQKPEEARMILLERLHANYDDTQAWFWLAHCAEDEEEYARALREVLRLDPENVEARRLAVQLARQTSKDKKPLKTPPPTQDTNLLLERDYSQHYLRSFFNLLFFLIIIGISLGVAYWWLNPSEDENTNTNITQSATLDESSLCTQQMNTIIRSLTARCSTTRQNQVCLASNGLNISSSAYQTTSLRVPGDKTSLELYTLLETKPFNASTNEWGSLVIRAQTNAPESTDAWGLFLITSGVRLTDFDERFQNFSFFNSASAAASPPCAEIPASGILVHSDTVIVFGMNGSEIEMNGTAFFQLDVAAGLRIAVLEGRIKITTLSTEQTIQAGEVLQQEVESNRMVRNVNGTISGEANRIRGNLRQLVPFAENLGIATENWAFPGERPRVSITPTSNAIRTPTPELPELDVISTIEVTPEPTEESDTSPTPTIGVTVTRFIPTFTVGPTEQSPNTPRPTLTPINNTGATRTPTPAFPDSP